jgi:hypothetical protein
MSNLKNPLQSRAIVNAQTARQFHLHAIEHLEKALAFHRDAVGNHDQGDYSQAARSAALAQTHLQYASEHTAGATKHYCEQMFYK